MENHLVGNGSQFCAISDSEDWIRQAAHMLTRIFCSRGNDTWPDYDSARKEVGECISPPNLCIGLRKGHTLLGWLGLRPMYKTTWEMHPLVVDTVYQRQGVGRRLLAELERIARRKGINGIVLGADDEEFRTSLSQVTLDRRNLWGEIQAIRNLNQHPYEFYEKCGYLIVGVIPDANGKHKPDIWMWKGLD